MKGLFFINEINNMDLSDRGTKIESKSTRLVRDETVEPDRERRCATLDFLLEHPTLPHTTRGSLPLILLPVIHYMIPCIPIKFLFLFHSTTPFPLSYFFSSLQSTNKKPPPPPTYPPLPPRKTQSIFANLLLPFLSFLTTTPSSTSPTPDRKSVV